jgi:hypothetical protein
MNSSRWQIRLGFVLLLIAAGFDIIHYLVFRDSDYIFKFVLAQLGFLLRGCSVIPICWNTTVSPICCGLFSTWPKSWAADRQLSGLQQSITITWPVISSEPTADCF